MKIHVDRKSAISLQRRQFDQKFQVEGDVPTNNFCTDSYANECLTTLLLTVFTRRNFVAGFLRAKCDFRGKSVNDHHRLIRKRVSDFLLVLIEVFR